MLTITEKPTVNIAQETKEAICNVLIISQLLYNTVQSLPTEVQFGLPEQLLAQQRKLVPLIPPQTQQWVMKEISKEKLNTLPVALKNHIRTGDGAHEKLYSQLHELLAYLGDNKKRARLLDEEKYRLLLKFIQQELEADLTNGEPALAVADGSITFKLQKPTPGVKLADTNGDSN